MLLMRVVVSLAPVNCSLFLCLPSCQVWCVFECLSVLIHCRQYTSKEEASKRGVNKYYRQSLRWLAPTPKVKMVVVIVQTPPQQQHYKITIGYRHHLRTAAAVCICCYFFFAVVFFSPLFGYFFAILLYSTTASPSFIGNNLFFTTTTFQPFLLLCLACCCCSLVTWPTFVIPVPGDCKVAVVEVEVEVWFIFG